MKSFCEHCGRRLHYFQSDVIKKNGKLLHMPCPVKYGERFGS